MFEVKIRTGGAAFKHDSDEEYLNEMCEVLEVKRLLNKIIRDMQEGDRSGSVMDINGNKVGEWRFD